MSAALVPTNHGHHQRAHVQKAICQELAILVVHCWQLLCGCPKQRHSFVSRAIHVHHHHAASAALFALEKESRGRRRCFCAVADGCVLAGSACPSPYDPLGTPNAHYKHGACGETHDRLAGEGNIGGEELGLDASRLTGPSPAACVLFTASSVPRGTTTTSPTLHSRKTREHVHKMWKCAHDVGGGKTNPVAHHQAQ